MRPQLHVLLFAIALLFPLSVSSVSAQTPTFNVEGVVTDEQQAVLPGVTVTMHNVATGLTRTSTTDTSGRYVFSGLPPEGRYEIANRADRLRQPDQEQPGFQRRPAGGDQHPDEAVVAAGNDHRRR